MPSKMYRSLDGHELPSYTDATSQDHWKLVAPYIASSDLCSASLLCSRWHEIFAPQLWGHPASHFGTEDDSVYVALTRFRRTLPWARLYLRQMTHTLHLPPAHAEIYEGPHPDWLRDMLERLPRLQCLILEALPFFDHGCLMALRRPLTVHAGPTTYHSAHSLRLLNASRCSNATYSGLAAALQQMPELLYLDLSETSAARNPEVLRALRCMQNLQALKLKKVGLKDDAAEELAKAIGIRVRSLDVSCNHLTDVSARALLEHCFRTDRLQRHNGSDNNTPPEPGGDTLRQYFGEALELHLQERLTRDFADRLIIQDDVEPGLTHLYISDNQLTVEGISSFLRPGTIQCLDAGSLFKHSLPTAENEQSLPGTEKLVTTMRQFQCDDLAYLRVDHDFVTKEAVVTANGADQPAELLGTVPMLKPDHAQELDSRELIELGAPTVMHELGSQAIVELEGDSKFLPGSQSTSVKASSSMMQNEDPAPPRRGSALAPEATDANALPEKDLTLAPSDGLHRRYSEIVEERKARAKYRVAHSTYFTPSFLPNLHTLVLCNVPEKVSNQDVPKNIIRLINDCAKDHDLAKEEARQSYGHPPGRSQKSFERDYLRSIFALERIILEIAERQADADKAVASWRTQPTSKSTTEDTDSEAFWDAAQQDFTFFDEEECGQPLEKSPVLPSWFIGPVPMKLDGKDTASKTSKAGFPSAHEPQIDVVAEITKSRRERKAAKEARVAAGFPDEPVEGFWEGHIQVVRPDQLRRRTESKDCYGNVFEKGFRYR